MSKQFLESRPARSRERWPVAYDIEGVPRDTKTRTLLKSQQESEPMPKALSPNSFVAGATIDLNKPAKEAYNPRDPKNAYPKMLYHPTEKNAAELKEHKRITLYNSLHPEKPEVLPPVSAAYTVVMNKDEEAAALKKGWALRAPAEKEQTEVAV